MTRDARQPVAAARAGRVRPADRSAAIFSTLIVLLCAASVLLTWPLWQTRAAPPLLPIAAVPSLSMAVPLLAALVLYLAAPAYGLAAYWILLAYGVVADQARLQPEFISFGFLMAAGLPGTAGVTVARVHLLTLWFYAGLHKLISVDFIGQTDDPFMLSSGVFVAPTPAMRAVFPWLVVAMEVGVAACALGRRTRRIAAAGAVMMHIGILLVLINAGWNHAVWPWNVAGAAAGPLLILPWTTRLSDDLRALRWPLRALAAAMALYPLGFYAGVADAYLSHCLYAQNEPRGYVCSYTDEGPDTRAGLGATLEYRHPDGPFHCRHITFIGDLGAPLPPIHRLFEQYFARTCLRDEFLLIQERRWLHRDSDDAQRILNCPGAAPGGTRFDVPDAGG